MRFSWNGLILAPLAVPLAFSVVLAPALGGGWRILPFMLVLLMLGCILSYGTTILLFLPSLFLLSLWRPMTGIGVALLGLVLGTAMLLPVTWLQWTSSGPDSGPPTESFLEFFRLWLFDPLNAVFPLAGLITAALYWWLGTRRQRQPAVAPT